MIYLFLLILLESLFDDLPTSNNRAGSTEGLEY